ncbi:hypothetical protein FRC03_002456 [Tulasnella sp. 419]|nr:hypothetical protein FRC03_002456 [Tulasnella sp. 419]
MDIIQGHDKSRITPEFQAVILAGTGTNLAPLTRNYLRGRTIEETVPKALLPIGNKPMISFPLAWLDAAGIVEVLIICPASHRQAISHFIHSSSDIGSLHCTFQTIDDDDEAIGTADVLRSFAGQIQTDFILLPCDFIPPPSLSLSKLLNAYRMDTDQPQLAALLYEKGEVGKDGPSPLAIGMCLKTNTLSYIPSGEGRDDLELRMSLMWHSPTVRFTTRYLDSHVYIMRHTVLALLAERTDISSVKEELVPWLCRTQYRTSSRRKYGSILNPRKNPQALALTHTTTRTRPRTTAAKNDESEEEEDGLSAVKRGLGLGTGGLGFSSIPPSMPSSPPPNPRLNMARRGSTAGVEKQKPLPKLRCTYVTHALEDGVATRANTVKSYFDANRLALHDGSYVPAAHVPQQSSQPHDILIDPKAQISTDSIIGASTRIGERTSVKKSVIGSHCIIGKGVKISGCIIMDHTVIKDGCKLDNSIFSRHMVVNEKCTVKDCEAATGVILAAGGDFKGEKFEQYEFDDEDGFD